jgi:pimeloyl-ACP methyl ester carboxylesterase
MAQWLAALDLTNVDLVGHSFGAGVAQVMLLECRQRVRRLVLVSAGGLGREIALPLRLASLPVVIERFGQPFMGLGVHVALHLARDGRTGADIAALRRFNERPGSARAFSRTVRDIIGWSGQRRSFAQRVHEVPDLPPLGVIWGARDAIIPAHHGASLAESVDCVRVTVLPGCGHYLHHQAPVRFANAVRGFLDDDDVLPARVRVPARRARSG